jgi:hypothetical protein
MMLNPLLRVGMVPAVVQPGFISMFAFWMGGGGMGPTPPAGGELHALPFMATPGRLTAR